MTQPTIQQLFDAAFQHHKSGRLSDAEPLYREILKQDPTHPAAMHHLGLIAYQLGRNDVAAKLITQAIALNPNYADAHSNLGMVLRALGQLDQAIDAYHRAIALMPASSEVHNNLAIALAEKGELDQAILAYRRAILLKPDYAEAHNNLGNALRDHGQLDDAIAAYRHAIALNPRLPQVHNHLGIALAEKSLFDEAIAAFEQAISDKPDSAEAYSGLGNALSDKGDRDKAIAAYRRALSIDPKYAEAGSNLGKTLRDRGQLDDAIAAYRQAIALKPDYPDAHKNLAMALLSRGEFPEGWREYEWRWKCKDFPAHLRVFTQPRWDGSPLDGRTILLHTEQGFGDAIQFIRYLPQVKQRGGKIAIACRAELVRLFQANTPGCQILAPGEPLPPFDVYCPLLSLPRIFATTLDNIPNAVPYLHAEANDAKKWRHRVADHSSTTNVGLVWAGNAAHQNDRNRSMTLAIFAALAQAHNVRFFSLQKGPPSAQAKSPPAGMMLTDWTEELNDFSNTAALIANLHLVIAVDTAAVHLAGALGKPVWTLLPFVADWRWMLDREDTQWYPTMRLFRQTSEGDWQGVIDRVTHSLSEFASRRSMI